MREYTCRHRDYPLPMTLVAQDADCARVIGRMLLRSPARLDRYVPIYEVAVIDVEVSGHQRAITQFLLKARPLVRSEI